MTFSPDEFKLALDKYGVEYEEESEIIGDREYVGIHVVGDWNKLPSEVSDSFFEGVPNEHLDHPSFHMRGEEVDG